MHSAFYIVHSAWCMVHGAQSTLHSAQSIYSAMVRRCRRAIYWPCVVGWWDFNSFNSRHHRTCIVLSLLQYILSYSQFLFIAICME